MCRKIILHMQVRNTKLRWSVLNIPEICLISPNVFPIWKLNCELPANNYQPALNKCPVKLKCAYLVTRAHADLSLCVRQSFGVWIVTENAEEGVWQWLEVTHRGQVLVFHYPTLAPAITPTNLHWHVTTSAFLQHHNSPCRQFGCRGFGQINIFNN